CPSRPGHPALRNNFASSLPLRTWLPYDWTPRSEAYFVFPLALCARRVSSAASRLLGSTSLRFALHGWQRMMASCLFHCFETSQAIADHNASNLQAHLCVTVTTHP
ncbi:hypothetical protein, partial [Thiolapillus sp.]